MGSGIGKIATPVGTRGSAWQAPAAIGISSGRNGAVTGTRTWMLFTASSVASEARGSAAIDKKITAGPLRLGPGARAHAARVVGPTSGVGDMGSETSVLPKLTSPSAEHRGWKAGASGGAKGPNAYAEPPTMSPYWVSAGWSASVGGAGTDTPPHTGSSGSTTPWRAKPYGMSDRRSGAWPLASHKGPSAGPRDL
jgi:hypothetical protein